MAWINFGNGLTQIDLVNNKFRIVGSKSGEYFNISPGEDFNATSRYFVNVGNINTRKTFNLIGDSISEGVRTDNFISSSFGSIFGKSFQQHFGNRNWGFVNFNTSYEAGANAIRYMNFTRSGFDNYTGPFDYTVYGGAKIRSVTSGETVTFTYTGKDFQAVYQANVSGGSLVSVTVDGNLLGTIDTKLIASNKNGTDSLAIASFSQNFVVPAWGNHTVVLTNTQSNDATFMGIQFVENVTQITPLFNNVGISGIQAVNIPDALIDYYCSSGNIILALGTNDYLNSANTVTFKAKMKRFFDNIKNQNGSMLVCDFIFSELQSNAYKTIIRDLGKEYGVRVLDFSLLWKGANSTDNIYAGLLDEDETHPTSNGMMNIANTILKEVGLPYDKHSATFQEQIDEKLSKSAASTTYFPITGGVITGDVNIAKATSPTLSLVSQTPVTGKNFQLVSRLDGKFIIYDATAGQDRLFIDDVGNIGMGVEPLSKLHVNGSIRAVTNDGTPTAVVRNVDIPFENYLASGTGASTTITIPHGLTGITAASKVIVQPLNAASAGVTFATIGSVNIVINYTIAPVLGTNNLNYSILIKK